MDNNNRWETGCCYAVRRTVDVEQIPVMNVLNLISIIHHCIRKTVVTGDGHQPI